MKVYISEENLKIVNLIKKEIQKYSMTNEICIHYVESKNLLNNTDIFILGSSKMDEKLSSFIKKIRYVNPIAKIIVIGLGNEQARHFINEGATPDIFIDRKNTKQLVEFHSLFDKICKFLSK